MERRVRVRFAPSPTGPLHIGGVRTALFNYLFAKNKGGDFILRIEDTDQTRFVPGAEQYITEAFEWLGLTFDESPQKGGPHKPYRQSERKPMYAEYAQKLIQNGTAYYAFDTEEELAEMKAKMTAAGVSNPTYNLNIRHSMKNSLTLSPSEVEDLLAKNVPYVIRLLVPKKEEIRFQDLIRGWVNIHSSQIDDKVLLKSDGMPTYHLANVVDDYLMQISHVIRGEEWLPSTPLHVLLYRAFGWEEVMPSFAHLPLLLKPVGNGKLSKRDGDQLGFPVFPLQWKDPASSEISSGYRESGYFPEALINFLALLGWNAGTDQELFSMDEMIQLFKIEEIHKAGAKFDYQKGIWFNQNYLRKKNADDLLADLKTELSKASKNIPNDDYLISVIQLLKDRVSFVSEMIPQGIFFFERPTTYDPNMVSKSWNPNSKQILELLAGIWEGMEEWKAAAIELETKDLIVNLGSKPGQIMPAIRMALAGVSFGPGVFEMAEVLGQEESVLRLKNCLASLA